MLHNIPVDLFIPVEKLPVVVIYLAEHSAGVTHGNHILRDVLCDYRSGAYNRVVTDGDSRDDRSPCSDPDVISYMNILIVLQLFINKTKQGQAMLAASEDKGAATLMGINVNRTIALTFAIGSALAAVAGALLCSAYPSLSPYTGAMPGIKAFVAAVLGGIGSIPGAMIGGLVLGIVEILSKTYISSQLSDAIVFGILVVVLLVKPTGILGKKIQEKV